MVGSKISSYFLIVLNLLFASTLFANFAKIQEIQKLSWEGKYDEAIAEYDKILAKEPDNLEALDNKADVLSWKGQNNQAVETYNKYLSKKYDARVARKKARVLSWDQNYSASIDTYNEAYYKTQDQGSKLEGSAKKAWWNNHTLKAIKDYNRLIELEPDNLEARSDVAQLKAFSNLPEEAIENYEYITTKHDWHFMAKEGLEKVKIKHSNISYKPSFLWFSSTSADRYTYIRRLYSELLFSIPIKKRYSIVMGYNLDSFMYPGSSITRNYGVLGAEALINERFWLNGIYGITAQTSNKITSQKYRTQFGFIPFTPVVITVLSQRDDLINSKAVIEKKLHTTDIGSNIRISEHRLTSTIVEYKYSFINDGNRENYLSLEQQLYVLKAPKEITISVGLNYQDWKIIRTEYFSPKNFWSLPITIRWRHYLNKNGLYYGANDTYYGLRYKFQMDKGATIFNGGGLEFHHDFSKIFGIHYEVFGNYSDVYKDIGMYLGFVGFFL